MVGCDTPRKIPGKMSDWQARSQIFVALTDAADESRLLELIADGGGFHLDQEAGSRKPETSTMVEAGFMSPNTSA